MLQASLGIKPTVILANVLFPHPLFPIKAKISFGKTFILILDH